MGESRRLLWTGMTLAVLALSAWLSNTLLFRQTVQGNTELTHRIPTRFGSWEMVDEAAATPSEVRGLETSDIIKRTYFNGKNYMELIVAYIAHSSRKSAHAQEACLRGSGALVGSIEERKMEKSPVSAKLISIDVQDRRQWVCYWYKIGSRYTADYLQSSLLMFLGGVVGKTNRGASLIRILTPELQGESHESVLERIEDFTRLLTPELEKTLP